MKQVQITVFVGVVFHAGKVLLFQRSEKECAAAHAKWDLPGGKVEFGETPQDALAREFLEETGVKIQVGRLLPHVQINAWDYGDRIQQTIVLGFQCRWLAERVRTADHHVQDVAWVDRREIKDLNLLPGIETFIQLAR